MIGRMKRRVDPEFIDDPATPTERLEYLLRCVRTVNRRMGGISMLLDSLKAWSSRWPRDREITLLDIGTGSGDIPLAAVEWAERAGFRLRAVGIDASPRVLDVARRLCRHRSDVEFVELDAMSLLGATSPYGPESFDYVHAGMFVHHLDDDTVPRMLRAMNEVARAGIIWNDLIRTIRGYAVTWLATIGQPIRHDCLASLRAGFNEREALDLALRAGIDYARYRERYNVQRFSVAGEKKEAWAQGSLPRVHIPIRETVSR